MGGLEKYQALELPLSIEQVQSEAIKLEIKLVELVASMYECAVETEAVGHFIVSSLCPAGIYSWYINPTCSEGKVRMHEQV